MSLTQLKHIKILCVEKREVLLLAVDLRNINMQLQNKLLIRYQVLIKLVRYFQLQELDGVQG
ncbi:hypothetical protein D3C87_1807680 [compost metagenome]